MDIKIRYVKPQANPTDTWVIAPKVFGRFGPGPGVRARLNRERGPHSRNPKFWGSRVLVSSSTHLDSQTTPPKKNDFTPEWTLKRPPPKKKISPQNVGLSNDPNQKKKTISPQNVGLSNDPLKKRGFAPECWGYIPISSWNFQGSHPFQLLITPHRYAGVVPTAFGRWPGASHSRRRWFLS